MCGVLESADCAGATHHDRAAAPAQRRHCALTSSPLFFHDSHPPPHAQAFSWSLDAALSAQLDFLHAHVAPHTPAVAGAVRFLRSSISRLPASLSLADARAAVGDAVDAYVAERVRAAAQVAAASLSLLPRSPPEPAARRRAAAVSGSATSGSTGGLTLWPGAVVMTYGRSAAVAAVLAAAHAQLTDAAEAADASAPSASASAAPAAPLLHVVVVDARPDLRGQAAAAAYAAGGLGVTYTQLASAPAALRSVDVLLLGAAAVLGDGAVLAAAGTAQLAAVAASAGVPVVVAAESFKLTDRVVTSSLAINQVAPTADVAHTAPHTPRKRGVPKALAVADAPAAAADAAAPAAPAAAAPQPQQQQPKGGKAGGKGAAAAAAPAPAVVPWVSTGIAGDAPADAAGALAGWRGVRGLKLAGVAYDVTPPGLVAALLTEVGPLPPGGAGVAAVCRAFGRLEETPQDDDEDGDGAADADDGSERGDGEDEEGERDGGAGEDA